MMKKLRSEEKKDQQQPDRSNAKMEVLSSKSFFAAIGLFSMTHAEQTGMFPSMKPVSREYPIFHPPPAILFI